MARLPKMQPLRLKTPKRGTWDADLNLVRVKLEPPAPMYIALTFDQWQTNDEGDWLVSPSYAKSEAKDDPYLLPRP